MKRDEGMAQPESLPLVIKRADRDGIEKVVHLFDRYRQFYGQDGDLPGANQFIVDRIESADSMILVAQSGEELVGFTQLYPTYSSVAMRRAWVLNDLFVVPEYRRLSVGRRLLGAAVEHGLSTGSARLVLATQVGNLAAKSLYEREGWVRDTAFDHYSKVLTAD